MTERYEDVEPTREEVDAWQGPVLLEFGNAWCGHCARSQPLLSEAMQAHPGVRHLKIADASRQRLGRTFQVKLWPTLIFLRDGHEVARVVRPHDAGQIRAGLGMIDPAQRAEMPASRK